jgi:hypothetical protein
MTMPMPSESVIAEVLQRAKVLPTGRRCAVWPAQVTSAMETVTLDGWMETAKARPTAG